MPIPTSLRTHDIAADISRSIDQLRALLAEDCLQAIQAAADLLISAFDTGHKVLLCGNGGSAADAQHIAAELVGRYVVERRGLPAIALSTDTSVLTAWSNDYDYDSVFARQVDTLAQPGDVVWGLSTSGDSASVVQAFDAARRRGASTLGLLGRDGGRLRAISDIAIVVGLQETARVQEGHRVVYHVLCSALDRFFAPAPPASPGR